MAHERLVSGLLEAAVDVAQKGWDPASVIDEAAASMVSVLQGLATAGIWFVIVWLPILLIVGIVAAVVIAIARRFGYGRRTPGGMPPAPIVGEG